MYFHSHYASYRLLTYILDFHIFFQNIFNHTLRTYFSYKNDLSYKFDENEILNRFEALTEEQQTDKSMGLQISHNLYIHIIYTSHNYKNSNITGCTPKISCSEGICWILFWSSGKWIYPTRNTNKRKSVIFGKNQR